MVVEWKAGASFLLSQLERYLWECDVLILVKVPTNQVVRIVRTDIEGYLKTSLTSLTERSVAIGSNDDLQKVAGPYCKGCPVQACEFYRQDRPGKMVAFNSESMRQDLLTVFNNLDNCIDEAVKAVVKELT